MDNLDFDDIVGDKYQPVEWLGGGAMSRLLKAKDTSIGNLPVAIKFLVPPARGATKGQEGPLLEREMEAMVRLHAHSYVVQVKDFGWLNDETPYLVMDFMPVGSLKDRLSAGPLTPALQRRVLEELCDALDFIHEQGIAHLDLKPSNIFLDRGLHTRIGDFGIAQALEQAYPDVVAAGTPGYMAPEQKDKQLPVDRRADIYALGIVTWQMLTGTLPEPRSLGDDRLHPELVKAIRRACSPDPSDRYDSAGAFWKSIRTWLPRRQVDGTTACPDYQFGNLLAQIPLTYRNRVRRVLEDYTAVFGGRDRELEALDEWLFDAEEQCGLLQAPAGRGKTALLANWTREMEHYGWRVVFHPISIRYETASMNTTVRCLGHALAPLFDADPPGLNESLEVVRARIVEWLRHGMPEDERLLLVVDGLDEAIGDYVKSLFPTVPGPRVKLLVSARPLAGTDRLWWVHQVKWDVAATTVFDLGPLNHSDIADLLRGQPGNELNALADDAPFINELARVSEGDPLTTRIMIDGLRAGDVTPESLSRRPPGLNAYLEEWMRQLEEQAASEAAWRLLGLCAVALGPLTADDLAQLAPDGFRMSRDVRRAVRSVDRFILGDGQQGSGYVFGHPRLREYFKDQLLDHECKAYRDAFVRYGKRAFDDFPRKPCPAYVRRFWARHLYDAGKWDELHEIVATDQGEKLTWAEVHHSASGSYAEYLSDLSLAWQHADEMEAPETITVGRLVRYALIESSIHSLATNIPVPLLEALIERGVWTPVQALAYARQSPDPDRRASGLAKLVPHLSGELRRQVLGDALGAAREIGRGFKRAQAMAELAHHLPERLEEQVLDEALQAALSSEEGYIRALALARLVRHLPSGLQGQTLDHALAIARHIDNGENCATVLAELAPHVKKDRWYTVFEVARSIKEDGWRAKVLAELAPYLTEDSREEVLEEAQDRSRRSEDRYSRAEALAALVPHLPVDSQEPVVREVLEAARGIEEEWRRANLVVRLAPYVSRNLSQEALEVAREIDERWHRVEALAGLVPLLSQTSRQQVLGEAMALAQEIDEHYWRAIALSKLAPHLSRERLHQAVGAVRRIEDAYPRAQTLATLVPHLAKTGHWDEALEAAEEITWLEGWATALAGVAPYLPEDVEKEALDEALAAAQDIEGGYSRAETLVSLVSHLPVALQERVVEEALDATHEIEDGWWRDEVLAELVPHVGRLGHPQQALRLARGIEIGWRQSQALARLTQHLSIDLLREALGGAREIEGYAADQFRVFARVSPRLAELGCPQTGLAVAREITDPAYRAQALLHLARHLPESLREQLLDDGLREALEIEDWWGQTGALVGLAPILAELGHPREALTITANEIGHKDTRYRVLEALARHLVDWAHKHPVTATDAWQEALHALAARTREELLSDLRALSPFIATLGGRATVTEAFRAIQDVGRWWP